ncbi:MAG TPA: class II glutamine amidotransferase [Bacteroidia bacterium]|nr:class II glutamine amidotransferase [Bacteroidia bacterium]
MCRMIAKASIQETSVMDEMLNCPYSLQYLSAHGRQPDDPSKRGHHRDGCGMAFIHHDTTEIHKRDREHAWDDSYIQTVKEARSKLFIAHNRLASAGLESGAKASHPFEIFAQGSMYAFSHNGTIYNFVDEAKKRNTSDSFIFLEHLISKTEPNDDEAVIKRIITLAQSSEYSSMTAFLLAPDHLMIWRIFNEKDKAKLRKRILYYTMYMKLSKNNIVFSSEPLDDDGWTLMPENSFISVKPSGSHLQMNYRLLF